MDKVATNRRRLGVPKRVIPQRVTPDLTEYSTYAANMSSRGAYNAELMDHSQIGMITGGSRRWRELVRTFEHNRRSVKFL